jgi:hypothetical protein
LHVDELVAEHSPHAPEGWQAGVAPPQSPSAAHDRQAWVAVLQTGVVPPHWALDVHGTQVALATSHAGVAPVHLMVFVAEQTPQAPDVWQAGVGPPHSLSPGQARQVCAVVLQTGVVLPHWAFETQGTQVPVVVRQIGVAPLHAEALVAEHCPQAPEAWQAGVAPPQSASAAQARQVRVARLHTGAVPPHWAFEVHGTQVPVVA